MVGPIFHKFQHASRIEEHLCNVCNGSCDEGLIVAQWRSKSCFEQGAMSIVVELAALQAAFELGSFDAAQQVAANTGLAIWLFSAESLLQQEISQRDEISALRWVMFSEWLCRCAGASSHSAWNAIYLMRIARAKCPRERHPALNVFRWYRPVTPKMVAAAAGVGRAADLKAVVPLSWHALAQQLYGALEQGAVRYRLLQRCGLLLEYGWFAAHDGDTDAAAAAISRLRKEMRSLPSSDRAFFVDSLECLPQEVVNSAA